MDYLVELFFPEIWCHHPLTSIGVKGATFFNLVPNNIINFDSENVDMFKKGLDNFLSLVLEQPNNAKHGRMNSRNQ